MKIAILGATSQIAKDFIVALSQDAAHELYLFARNPKEVARPSDSVACGYHEFSTGERYDLIINFVGIGDPARAKAMGHKIFEVTEYYDNMALAYLERHTSCKYIFLSSGAVYGDSFSHPVTESSPAIIDINHLQPTDWYAIAKLYAEAKHRAMSAASIIDIRVFNYFSHTQDMNARFLITDLVRAIKSHQIFSTSAENIIRDFITPTDLHELLLCAINGDPCNLAIDCYTKAPIDKLSLLKALKKKFGLKYELVSSGFAVNATGIKNHYYSTNTIAEKLGYQPKLSSVDGLVREISKLI